MFTFNNFFKYLIHLLLLSVALFFASCESAPEPGPPPYDVISGLPNTSTYIQAIDRAEFDDDLKSGQSLTLIVPTDEAFDNYLAQNNFASINDVPLEELRNVLRYHILGFGAGLASLGNNYYLTVSPAGVDENFLAILIQNSGTKSILNGEIEVISQDVEADGSFISTIGEVLTLPTTESILRQNAAFEQFVMGIDRVDGLADTLLGTFHTLFVASDAAVSEALTERYDQDDIMDIEQASADSLMRFHILSGNHRSEQFLTALNFTYETFLPEKPMMIQGNNSVVVNNQAVMILGDIQATNGVVHIIDAFLDFD